MPCPGCPGVVQASGIINTSETAAYPLGDASGSSQNWPRIHQDATDYPTNLKLSACSASPEGPELQQSVSVGGRNSLFFRSGKITVLSVSAYDPSVSLSWGDVAVMADQQVVRVFLQCSKTGSVWQRD